MEQESSPKTRCNRRAPRKWPETRGSGRVARPCGRGRPAGLRADAAAERPAAAAAADDGAVGPGKGAFTKGRRKWGFSCDSWDVLLACRLLDLQSQIQVESRNQSVRTPSQENSLRRRSLFVVCLALSPGTHLLQPCDPVLKTGLPNHVVFFVFLVLLSFSVFSASFVVSFVFFLFFSFLVFSFFVLGELFGNPPCAW